MDGQMGMGIRGRPEQNFLVGKTEQALRYQNRRMIVRVKVGAVRQAGWHRRMYMLPVPAFMLGAGFCFLVCKYMMIARRRKDTAISKDILGGE